VVTAGTAGPAARVEVAPAGGGPARVGAAVAGVGLAYPPTLAQEDLWEGYFKDHYAGVQAALARRIFAHAGVRTRHSVVDPALEDLSGWSTGARMRRYLDEALPLGHRAVTDALAEAGLAPRDVGLFVVCSCTGYVTPGLDILLARDLGFPPDAQRLFVGHMGCYAAVPGLRAAADYVHAHDRPAVLLCLELTSLHVQPATADAQQIVSHALFSDAAAALVLRPAGHSPEGGWLAVREVASVTDVSTADHMTWDVTDLGFRMGLSPRVPDVLGRHLEPFVTGLLRRRGWTVGDVDGWAVHPGGPRILDVARDRLGLPEEALAASREVLAAHGNCSSPTVLMILAEVLRAAPRRAVMLAFGPGLTLYGAVLERA
jgi:predicted naringenin-chalcone synthase